MTAQPAADVHVHTHQGDMRPETENRPGTEAKSARRPARARVIPLRPEQGQEDTAKKIEDPKPGLGATLLAEMKAEAAEAAEESEWAREPMSVVDAAKQIVPAKGEASGKVAWAGMTVAGVLRLLLVSLGHLIAYAGATRTRAAITTLVVAIAIALSTIAAHAA